MEQEVDNQEAEKVSRKDAEPLWLLGVVVFLIVLFVPLIVWFAHQQLVNYGLEDLNFTTGDGTSVHEDTSSDIQPDVQQNSTASISAELSLDHEHVRYLFKSTDKVGVYECSSFPCVELWNYSFRVTPYSFDVFDREHYLGCAADGPTGSTYCTDFEINPYVNAVGTQGYKVDRVKTVITYPGGRVADKEVEKYPDIAYVYPIEHSNYQTVVFEVDVPTTENLAVLDSVADTFRMIPNPF